MFCDELLETNEMPRHVGKHKPVTYEEEEEETRSLNKNERKTKRNIAKKIRHVHKGVQTKSNWAKSIGPKMTKTKIIAH